MSSIKADTPFLCADAIPVELKALPRWVLWKYQLRNGKWTKVPFNPRTRRRADTTDAATWGSFDQALAIYRDDNAYDGIGCVIAPPYVGVDLDDCVDPLTGAVESWAREEIDRFNTYCEISPSETGVKLWARGDALPPVEGGGRRRTGKIEMYSEDRFFTVTGNRLANTPTDIHERSAELAAFYRKTFPDALPVATPHVTVVSEADESDQAAAGAAATTRETTDQVVASAAAPKTSDDAPDDTQIIKKVTQDPRYLRLWLGDASGYASLSEADLALAGRIAHYVGNDPAQIESIFNQGRLVRDKWSQRGDYRERTIAKALAGKTRFYDWTRVVADDDAGGGEIVDGANGVEVAGDPIGADDPEDLDARTAAVQPTPPPMSATAQNLAVIARLRTDVGNAARLVVAHGRDVRFCHPWGKWLRWTGTRWAIDDRGHLFKLAKRTALSIYAEAATVEHEERRLDLIKWAERSQSRERLTAMLEVAKADLSITPEELDADPWLLNVRNGTVNLRTKRLRPHAREDYLTKLCGARYEPSATAPMFSAFLARIFQSHPNLLGYVQRALGYGCTGSTREQVLFFLYGSGANGKTTLLDAVMHALGDYAGKADRDLLTAADRPAHPTNMADLMGRRLVVCSETNEGGRFDEAKLKDLVGETKIKARFMRQDFFEFDATHKVFLYSNHKPMVRGSDHGFWRRIRVIPFVERIGEAEKDAQLPAKLLAEADGILKWIVNGCFDWQSQGLGMPDEVIQATDGYRVEMDSIGAFLQDSCLYGERMEATARDLYASYTVWCDDNGEKPLSQKRLGTHLSERGLIKDRDTYSGRKIWRGIGLKTTPIPD